jgi:hypothetical protein
LSDLLRQQQIFIEVIITFVGGGARRIELVVSGLPV